MKKIAKKQGLGYVAFQLLKLLFIIINKVFHSKYKKYLAPVIKKLYGAIRRESFVIKSEIVQVKKGKAKYKVLFTETSDGKLRVNIGRHYAESK